jgi:hypothetical protein
MVPMKSQIHFYVDLCSQLVACDPLNVSLSKSLSRDIRTLQSRTHDEGLSFLTKSLPLLGKALDLALTTRHLIIPSSFATVKNENIPAFMQIYFRCVFDSQGSLRDDAKPEAVEHLRQVLYFAYKLEVPYHKKLNDAVLHSFIQTDSELEFLPDKETTFSLNVATFITEDVFKGFDPLDVVPRHGPGAVATGERLEDKWTFARLYNDIHQLYPYYDFFVVGRGRELLDRLAWYKSLERLEHGRAKVVLVPKDSRGPRLISCEPLEFQWIQQGLGRKLMSHLEGSYLTAGNINFTSQEVNRTLALSSSLDGSYATLDLKDASDRVSLALIRYVFKRTPLLLRCLEACRTTSTLLPDGSEVHLKKFAPMGSALCFPVEAFVFWVLMVAAVARSTRSKPSSVGKRIFVYGDDLIVPTEWVSICTSVLEGCSLLVNTSKCCVTGEFRESCGLDAFKGHTVTPFRLHTLWSGRQLDGSSYASYIAMANHLSIKYKMCSDFLWARLEATYGYIPYGTLRSPFPCRVLTSAGEAEDNNLLLFPSKVSRRYQRLEFRVSRLLPIRRKTKLDGWARLTRNIIMGTGDDPSTVVIPRSTLIKRGWKAV